MSAINSLIAGSKMALVTFGVTDLISLLSLDISLIKKGSWSVLKILFFNIFNLTMYCPEKYPLSLSTLLGSIWIWFVKGAFVSWFVGVV